MTYLVETPDKTGILVPSSDRRSADQAADDRAQDHRAPGQAAAAGEKLELRLSLANIRVQRDVEPLHDPELRLERAGHLHGNRRSRSDHLEHRKGSLKSGTPRF